MPCTIMHIQLLVQLGSTAGEICCFPTYGPYQEVQDAHIHRAHSINFLALLQISATSKLLDLGDC